MRVLLWFPTTRLVRFLAVVAAMLVVVHVGLQTWHYRVHELPWVARDLFDLDEENNIPAWYGAALMLLGSLLLAMIANARRQEKASDVRYWLGLSIGFVVISLGKDASLTDAFE